MCTTDALEFAAAAWSLELIDAQDDRPRYERDQLILLAASYGPPRRTDADQKSS